MIRIVEKEVEVIKKLEVEIEPEITTLYLVEACNKKVEVIKDVVFEKIVTKTKYTHLNFTKDYNDYRVYINPETLEITEDSVIFLDYETAVKTHRKRRIKYLKNLIVSFRRTIKEATENIERYEKLLEEFEKEN